MKKQLSKKTIESIVGRFRAGVAAVSRAHADVKSTSTSARSAAANELNAAASPLLQLFREHHFDATEVYRFLYAVSAHHPLDRRPIDRYAIFPTLDNLLLHMIGGKPHMPQTRTSRYDRAKDRRLVLDLKASGMNAPDFARIRGKDVDEVRSARDRVRKHR